MDSRTVWEHSDRDAMQCALAGSTPRDEYLRHRAQLAQEVVREFGLDGTQRGFELGSGEGIVARELAPLCASLDCADISRTFLDVARETCRNVPNVHFHLIDRDFLDFLPQNTYDFGFSFNVFVHLHVYDIFFYLCSVKRILKPGCLFYFNIVTIGESNRELFHEQAARYRKHQDPVQVRGLMNWQDIKLVRRLVAEAELSFREDRFEELGGHYKVFVEKP